MTSPEMIAILKKQPIGFSCGLLCLIIAAVLYIRSDKISESQAEAEAKSAEAAKILTNVSNSKNLPEQVAEIQALRKEMDSRLIRAGQLAINLQYFYKLEAETEVKLLDVRQNNPPRGPKALYIGIPYSLSVQGTFKQLLVFLHRLEDGTHFCHFTSASFSKSGAADPNAAGTGNESMTVSLNLELLGTP